MLDLRYGVISQVQRKPLRYKCTIADADGMETPWLTSLAMQSLGKTSGWAMPVGTQVALLLSDNAETGVVLGAVHSEPDSEPDGDGLTFDFNDGSKIQYDPNSQATTVKSVQAVNLDTPTTNAQDMNTKDIRAKVIYCDDVIVGGVSVKGHKHRENGKGSLTDRMQ